jgi:hypothetical protein
MLPASIASAKPPAGADSNQPRLLLHAQFDGDAALSTATGGQKAGRLLPGARFVPGRSSRGMALLSTNESTDTRPLAFPLEFYGQPRRDAQPAAKSEPSAALPLGGNINSARGTLCFWFQPQRRLDRTAGLMFDLLSSPGGRGPGVGYGSTRGEVVLRPTIFSGDLSPDNATCTFKRLEAGRWYHFAFTWDTSTRAIEGWLYGQVFASGEMTGNSTTAIARELLAGCKDIAIDDLRIYDRALTGPQLQAIGPISPDDILTNEAMVFPQRKIDLASLRGPLIYHNAFDTPDNLKDWRMEGAGQAAIEDGRLNLATVPDKTDPLRGHLVYWNTRNFPADFMAEWDFTPTRKGGLCIVFFAAKGRRGESIFDPSLPPRNGLFDRYYGGAIDCYHISYYRNSGNAQPESVLRKNYGFNLLEIGPDFCARTPGARTKITLIKQGGRIMFLTNGRLALDVLDDGRAHGPVLGGGNIGLRQMALTGQCFYDNFAVYELKSEAP